jgi:hypothetical protein
MSITDPMAISPYRALSAHMRTVLKQPNSDQTSMMLEITPDISVAWCWDSLTLGHLIADIPSPRALDAATLTHLATIALPSALRYPAIVVADQRKHRLKLVHANLGADVDHVMLALESLLNQCEVLATLLIDGPLRTPRLT